MSACAHVCELGSGSSDSSRNWYKMEGIEFWDASSEVKVVNQRHGVISVYLHSVVSLKSFFVAITTAIAVNS